MFDLGYAPNQSHIFSVLVLEHLLLATAQVDFMSHIAREILLEIALGRLSSVLEVQLGDFFAVGEGLFLRLLLAH